MRRDLPAPLVLRDGMRVLEVGCGNGETAADVATWFREAGLRAEIVAVDNRPECRRQVIDAAAANGVEDTVRFVAADVFALPALGRFDLLLCVNGLAQLVFEGSTARFPGLEAAAVVEAWRRAPEDMVTRVCDALLGHWRDQLVPQGTIVVLDLNRDLGTEARARGVALYERTKWPMLPVPRLAAALERAGFAAIRVNSIPQVRFPRKEEVHPSLGGGTERPQPHVPAPLWPLPAVGDDGDYEYAIYVLQAQRRD